MCGFSGFFTPTANASSSIDLLKKMGDALLHRGPDDHGEWLGAEGCIGLSHRRLAIVDISAAGHQPMPSKCGRYVIAFNGEIYNHLDLREQLIAEGWTEAWNGHSDTETLLACFTRWGVEKTLAATVGMFAIALWDLQSRTLTLARDRLGEKPLYWGWQGDVLLFGSELKSLKVHPSFKAEINRDAISLFMRHNYIPAPLSIYQGIQKLLPGHYVSIKVDDIPNSCLPLAYWKLNDAINNGLQNRFAGSDTEAISALEQQLNKSIQGQMLSDVPLGAFLSGGVDSSTIVSLMQAQSNRPIKTFTIGFNEPGYNEAEHALAVSKHLRTEHSEIYVSSNDALSLIPKLPRIYCEPFADSSQIPTFLVSQMAREHVTVSLSGDAGDELFGGYNTYQMSPKIWNKLSKAPLPLRQGLQTLLAAGPLPEKLKKLSNVVSSTSCEDFYRRLISHWQNPDELVLGGHEPMTLLNNSSDWPATDSYQNWMMAIDSATYMVDDILVKVDRAAMANSLETRVPMLDHRVVEFAWTVPLHMKIRDGKGKWILREVLYRHVPRELIERPKKGFSIPVGAWLRGPLKDWAETLLEEARLRNEGFFNVLMVRKIWSEHQKGRVDHSTKLWSILMFQAWYEVQA
ncbi:asparagine synthase (glutamine-hydrolyzing) [Pseudomonas sp. FSL W5-0299]|uniref:asparagine synthase (glutamine-hydrolyzing) n=1 Tax=Pseudomonas sp. FSL W5-0299 TaxID=1917484 RepID=UPI00098B6D50|nr:asparagine synthase (glutamine-hydrolyzing) [Pseudomonas sp. FSL W5-0299]OOL38564.1 asparagine synthase (glutamine-hydrolyzing) [Pseudomonas sp. FSL W5-0299]